MGAEPESAGNLRITCEKSAADLVAAAEAVGLRLRVEVGELVVRGPRSQIELGRAVITRKAEVLAYLASLDGRWDSAAAVRRMEAADAAVEASGSGADPAVQAAVARACEAYRLQDTAALSRTCDEVVALAAAGRIVSSEPRPAPRPTCPAAGESHALVAARAGLTAAAAAISASSGPVGLDLETTGLDHARHQVRLLQLATPAGTFLVDVFAVGPAALAPVFEALAAAGVVGHNLGFDLPFLMRLDPLPCPACGGCHLLVIEEVVVEAGDAAPTLPRV